MDDYKDYESEKENESGTSKIKNIFKNKKKPNLTVKFSESYEKFQTSIPAFLGICLCAFALMCFAAFAIFFMNVKGPE